MAALDFPDNPTPGTVFDKWTWNGTMWVLTASGSGGGGSGFTFNQDATPTATKVGDTWYETDTGDSFVWTNDGNSTQWVQFAPGSGGGGGSGFTYVTDTKPTPSKVGDTWFDTSTLASGGTSWLAIEESPGGEKVWVQTSPGAGNPAVYDKLPKGHQGLYVDTSISKVIGTTETLFTSTTFAGQIDRIYRLNCRIGWAQKDATVGTAYMRVVVNTAINLGAWAGTLSPGYVLSPEVITYWRCTATGAVTVGLYCRTDAANATFANTGGGGTGHIIAEDIGAA